jgi:hypothetical protein
MFCDELARIDPTARVLTVARADKWREELAHLKMEMREVLVVGVSNRRDLLAAAHILSGSDKDAPDMSIVGLHVFPRAILFVCVQDDDDIPPARPAIAREQNATVRNGEDRIAEIAVFAADAIEIITEVAIFREMLRVVSESAVFISKWKIESRRGW